MSKSKVKLEDLAARERQIVEAVYRLEEASVGDVLEAIANPPSYSAVRAMLTSLVQKGFLEFRMEKKRYLYRPVLEKDSARKSMLKNMLDNFFAGNPTKAVAAILDVAAANLDDEDFAEMKKLIEKARKENL